jgi:hypothetical protein
MAAPLREAAKKLVLFGGTGKAVTPGRQIVYTEHTGCHQLGSAAMRPTRVAATPGGCENGYADHTGCHQLEDVFFFTLQREVVKSANPIARVRGVSHRGGGGAPGFVRRVPHPHGGELLLVESV